ncbi:MAG: hypothetical protein AAB588_01155 [Patescibacteria group bacterium]
MIIAEPGVQVKLQVDLIKQGKVYIAYSPALDLSTTGKNAKQAQKRFAEMVDIFFEELIENNTLEEVLQDLGWIKVKKKWEPPQIISQKSFDVRVPVAL